MVLYDNDIALLTGAGAMFFLMFFWDYDKFSKFIAIALMGLCIYVGVVLEHRFAKVSYYQCKYNSEPPEEAQWTTFERD